MDKKHPIGERKNNYTTITEKLKINKLAEETSINKAANLMEKTGIQ